MKVGCGHAFLDEDMDRLLPVWEAFGAASVTVARIFVAKAHYLNCICNMEAVIHQPGRKDLPVHIPAKEASLADKFGVILRGVDKGGVDALAKRLGLGKTEALKMIGIVPSTFSRSKGRLNLQASDRVLLLEDIAVAGEDAFDGDKEAFQEWFRSSNVLLGNKSPMEACQFAIGVQEVQRILARIRTADFIA